MSKSMQLNMQLFCTEKGQYHLCRETLNKVSHILDLSSNNFL